MIDSNTGPNGSGQDRSVHYAQYSPEPITWTPPAPPHRAAKRRRADAPLWFAVPCAPTRETLERTRARANLATALADDGGPPGFSPSAPRVARRFLDPPALEAGGGDVAITVFRSPRGSFCLDGTSHPTALLTQSMASPSTLRAALRPPDAAAGAVVEYAVLDDLSESSWHALGLPPYPLVGVAKRPQLFVARGTARTQLHRDAFANCYVCVAGARRWTLAHADHGLERAPGAVSASGDLDRPPGIALIEVDLAPGDAIFVPAGWWHRVESTDDAGLGYSAAISWYVAPGGPASC